MQEITVEFLEEQGYQYIEEKPNGLLVAITPFIFTLAIVYGFTSSGFYTHRFCYKSFVKTFNALSDWDGEGEPNGWHRGLVDGQPERKISEGRLLTRNSGGQMVDEAGEIIVIY